MTPAQQTALEGLVGRSLTAEEVTAIDAHLPNRRDDLIAQVLSAGRVRAVKTNGGIGTVLETLGPLDGAAVLDGLEAIKAGNAAVKWAWFLIERGELDFGSPATRGMIDQLVAGGALPAAAGAALKAVAEVPNPITVGQVSDALNVAEGRLTLGGI